MPSWNPNGWTGADWLDWNNFGRWVYALLDGIRLGIAESGFPWVIGMGLAAVVLVAVVRMVVDRLR